MIGQRLLFHDLLRNRKSREVLLVFLLVGIIVGGGIWIYVDQTLRAVNINRHFLLSQANSFPAFLLSLHFRGFLIFFASVLAAGLTAFKVVGASSRIELWLEFWVEGKTAGELKVRSNDKFWYFTKLLNEWHRRFPR